jgi:multiple sugar transport system ATP-binding protein
MADIRVQDLEKAFGDFIAVKRASFAVRDGEFFCLLGPSGCGKTTTLRMIAGLELPTSGKIFLGPDDVSFKRASERDIAFVFQLFALYPHMNVRANIGFPLKCQGMGRREIRQRVEEAARILRITPLLDRPVSGLSGGDRQRVALGRAIVRQPMAFMMDEPLGALDAEFRQLMCGELRALHNRLKATTVYVTHDQLEAMSMADKIAVMHRGVIEQLGTPREIYDRPVSMFVADFIGSPAMNFLDFEGTLRRGDVQVVIDGAVISVPALREDVAEDRLVLGVRPEHVRLSDASPLRGAVYGTEYLGTTQIVTVTTERGTLKARLPSEIPARPGEQVGLDFRPEKLSLFEKSSGRAVRSVLHEEAAHG